MSPRTIFPILLLLTLVLAGCTIQPVRPADAPVPANAANDPTAPVEIVLHTTGSESTLTAQDTAFGELAAGLPDVIASITAQARTYFPPDRFSAEIAPLPHVTVRYPAARSFDGAGIAWSAIEIVLVAPDGEAMLLARADGIDDWSVYLPDDPTTLLAYLDAAVR